MTTVQAISFPTDKVMIISKWVSELQKSFEDEVILNRILSRFMSDPPHSENLGPRLLSKNERTQFDLRIFQMCTNVRFRNRKTENRWVVFVNLWTREWSRNVYKCFEKIVCGHDKIYLVIFIGTDDDTMLTYSYNLTLRAHKIDIKQFMVFQWRL